LALVQLLNIKIVFIQSSTNQVRITERPQIHKNYSDEDLDRIFSPI